MGPQLFRISQRHVSDQSLAQASTTSPVRMPEKPGIGLRFEDEGIEV